MAGKQPKDNSTSRISAETMLERILASFAQAKNQAADTGRDVAKNSASQKSDRNAPGSNRPSIQDSPPISEFRPEHTIPTGKGLHQAWKLAMQFFRGQHRERAQETGGAVAADLTIRDTNWNSWLDVTFEMNRRKYSARIAVNHATKQISWSCDCTHRRLCEHTFAMTLALEEMLDTPGTPLEEALMGKTLQERQQEKTLALLRSFTTVATSMAESHERPGEESDAPPLTRYAWNLAWNFASKPKDRQLAVLLSPIEMQERKNGGWTKGRELVLETFVRNDRSNWSSLEHQIAQTITVGTWHPASMAIVDALRILSESDAFMLNREPATVSVQPLEIYVSEVPDGYLLETTASRLLAPKNGSPRGGTLTAKNAILVVLPHEKRVVALTSPSDCGIICDHLLEHPFVPAQGLKQLQATLETLSAVITVHMPPAFAGEERPIDPTPAILLHLRHAGVLDVSVVIRTSNSQLEFPGEGPARTIVDEKEGRFHHVRNLQEEIRLSKQLAEQLQVQHLPPMKRWVWRVTRGEEISSILATAGALVENSQVTVLWHKESASKFDVIGRVSAANVRVSVTRQRDWFGLEGTCRIGDQEIPLKELLAGLHGRPVNGMIEVSPGKWASIADDVRNALTRLADVSLESRGKLQLDMSAAPVVSALEQAEIQVAADRHWEKCLHRLRNASELVVDPPATLNATLRDYQTEGFRWMSRLAQWGIGGILADDMGLGKTVQTLAVLLTRAETGPALIIAPTSLGFNWQRECERFSPSLRPILFRESDRGDLINQIGSGDLVICSYGLALREADLLKEISWGTLVLDEAQSVKNSNSKTAAAVRSIRAEWKIALTGTPMENHLGELWSIFHTVAPGVLGSWEQFRRRFANPIEKERNPDRQAALSRVIAPFVLRRSKGEVLRDLPARTESNLLVDLTPAERARYDKMRLVALKELDDIGGDDLSSDQRFKVLQILTRLRQLACHVGLVDKTWTDSSSKMELLMERLLQLKERGSRPLIFSQFTSHLALIRTECEKAGVTFQYLDGQTTPAQRQERVEAFQRGEGDAFLISLKAGGTGLNLTAADYVIHMDPWWNPAVEDQATDRAHRIGQTKPVMVYRIIARGTIEEQILQMHGEKRDLVDSVLTGADSAAKLSTQDLADLIRKGTDTAVRL